MANFLKNVQIGGSKVRKKSARNVKNQRDAKRVCFLCVPVVDERQGQRKRDYVFGKRERERDSMF